jgi:hypothetical protein
MYMQNCNLGFLNAYQNTGGIYISFGNLKKFYMRFGEHTKSFYMPTAPVLLTVTSGNGNILLKTSLAFTPGEKCMVTMISSGKNISVIKISEPLMPRRYDKGYLRFINLSSMGPASLIQKGKPVFEQVEFCEKTNYILSGEGKYNFIIKNTCTAKALEVRMGAGEYKTIYLLGSRNNNKTAVICDRNLLIPGS